MAVTDREFQQLSEKIDTYHNSMVAMLEMRKTYWDGQIKLICDNIKDMKNNCSHTQDQCAIVFKELDKRIDANTHDIGRIKTVGGVAVLLWGGIASIAGHLLRKLL